MATAIGLVTASAAQSLIAATKSSKTMGDTVHMTGCVEAGASSGSYMLTHMTPMGKMPATATSTEDAPKGDRTGTVTSDRTPPNVDMGKPMMLMGTSVDLGKHMGHKVTVMGMENADGMMVKSVKMIAKTCP
jgi:hypothetical protein